MNLEEDNLERLLKDICLPADLTSRLKDIPSQAEERLDELLRKVAVPTKFLAQLKQIPDSQSHSKDLQTSPRQFRTAESRDSSISNTRHLGFAFSIAVSLLALLAGGVWYAVNSGVIDSSGRNSMITATDGASLLIDGALIDQRELQALEEKIASLEDELRRARLERLEQDLWMLKAELDIAQQARRNRDDEWSLKLAYFVESSMLAGTDPAMLRDNLQIINQVYPNSVGAAMVNEIFSRVH